MLFFPSKIVWQWYLGAFIKLENPAGHQFGGSVCLGEEFMASILALDFKSASSTFPFTRTALVATQMTSTRAQQSNGVARLLVKGDFEKVRSHKEALKGEEMLASAFKLPETDRHLSPDQKALLLGRLMCRLVLHIVGKESKGREDKTYKDLPEINAAFGAEWSAMTTHGSLAGPESTSASSGKECKPVELMVSWLTLCFFCYCLPMLENRQSRCNFFNGCGNCTGDHRCKVFGISELPPHGLEQVLQPQGQPM